MDKNVPKIEAKKPLILQRKQVCAYARVSSGKDEMMHSLSAQVGYYSELIQSRFDSIGFTRACTLIQPSPEPKRTERIFSVLRF